MGGFEEAQLDLVASYLKDCGIDTSSKVFIDIGANIGVHSIYFSASFSAIYAFEAHPRTYELLKFNTFEYSNIKTKHVGIGAVQKKMRLSSNRHNLGGSSFRYDQDQGQYFDVNIVSLDSLRNLFDEVGVIKIDVEGMEKEVIDGALEIISSDKPIVLFEHSLEDFDLDGESEVIIQLRNLGYKFLIYSSDWDQLSKLRRLARLTIGLLTGGFYKNHTLYECESIPVRHHDLIMAVPK